MPEFGSAKSGSSGSVSESSGSGSSGSSGSGGVNICDCIGVPTTLFVDVVLDECMSQNETFEINLVAPELGVFWRGTDSQGRQWDFFCTPETTDWIIEVSCSPPTVDHQFTNIASESCEPFEVVFEEPASSSVAMVPCFDCSTGTVTITVTE